MVRKISFIITLLFLGCIGLFAEDGIKIIHGPYIQNLEENEVTIVWVTNKLSIGWVELATENKERFYLKARDEYYDSSDGIKNIAKIHAVRITNLTPGTKYRYRIISREVLKRDNVDVFYGKTASTRVWKVEPLKFTTANRNQPSVSFAHFSDIHERAYDIPKLFKAAGSKDLDFVIYNGDMCNFSHNEESYFKGFMDTTVVTFAKELPMYYARGNHETRSYHASHFHDYFSPKKPHLYYTFRQGPVFFVVLDAGEDKPDNNIEYGGLADFDAYRSEQASWFKQVLESNEYQEAPVKIIISHVPFTGTNRKKHVEQEMLDKFVPLLKKHKPHLVMSGHWHSYHFLESNDLVPFPVIVNSNNTVIRTDVDKTAIKMIVYDTEGKVIDKKTILIK